MWPEVNENCMPLWPSAFSSQKVAKLGSRATFGSRDMETWHETVAEAHLQAFSEGQMSKNVHTYIDIDA